jgi:hypothetical protein
MSGEIRVSLPYLEELEVGVRTLPMDTSIAQYVDFSGSEEVDKAYDELQRKWSKHQFDLANSLENLGDVLKAIREGFKSVDSSYADAINPIHSKS